MKNNLEYKGYIVKEVDGNNTVTYKAYCKVVKTIFWFIKRSQEVNLYETSYHAHYLSEFGIFRSRFKDKDSAEKALIQAIEKYKDDLRSREIVKKEIIKL